MQLVRCASLVIVGCLLFSASCGDKQTAPTSGPAGLVLTVQGEVQARRPDQVTRTLKTNDEVFADDTLVTGPEASIELRLEHNGALWQLGPNNERRVDASVAWRAKRQAALALEDNEEIATAAAGRNSTREAAESRATLLEEPADEPQAQPASPQPGAAVTGKQKSESSRGSRRRSTGKQRDTTIRERSSGTANPARALALPRPKPSADNAPPPPQSTASPPPGSTTTEPSKTTTTTEAAPEPEPVLAAELHGADGDDVSESDDDDREASAAPSPMELQRRFVRELARNCQREHGGTGTLGVRLSAKNRRARSLQLTGPPALDKVKSCLRTRLGSARLPNETSLREEITLK